MEAKNVNIYFVPNNKNKIGGRFYNVYLNREERLDLAPFLDSVVDIQELEPTVQKEDETFKAAGGIIIKQNETIGSATVYAPDNGEIKLNSEEEMTYAKWLELENLSNALYEQRKKEMEAFLESQRLIDEQLAQLQEEKQKLSGKMQQALRKER